MQQPKPRKKMNPALAFILRLIALCCFGYAAYAFYQAMQLMHP